MILQRGFFQGLGSLLWLLGLVQATGCSTVSPGDDLLAYQDATGTPFLTNGREYRVLDDVYFATVVGESYAKARRDTEPEWDIYAHDLSRISAGVSTVFAISPGAVVLDGKIVGEHELSINRDALQRIFQAADSRTEWAESHGVIFLAEAGSGWYAYSMAEGEAIAGPFELIDYVNESHALVCTDYVSDSWVVLNAKTMQVVSDEKREPRLLEGNWWVEEEKSNGVSRWYVVEDACGRREWELPGLPLNLSAGGVSLVVLPASGNSEGQQQHRYALVSSQGKTLRRVEERNRVVFSWRHILWFEDEGVTVFDDKLRMMFQSELLRADQMPSLNYVRNGDLVLVGSGGSHTLYSMTENGFSLKRLERFEPNSD